MLSLIKRIIAYGLYEDMAGVTKLIVPAPVYNGLAERLEWGLTNSLEDGGLITVSRNMGEARIVDFYPAPDEFKDSIHVDFYSIWGSEWFKGLAETLERKRHKIGLEYHTHSKQVDYPQTEWEEFKTRERIRLHRIKEHNLLLEIEDYAKGDYCKREGLLGDLIIEMTKGGKVAIQGYTPSKSPYTEISSDNIPIKRETHSLEIAVPELDLRWKLPL